ncbi:DUF1330 domain-containing protein [Chloroflexota bacterium]
MSVYVIAMVKVNDVETYKKYTARTPAIARKYGGKFLARAGAVEAIEGEPFHDRLVILEFPSKEALHKWYASEEYQSVLKYRHASSTGRILAIEGAADTEAPDDKVVRAGEA